MPTLTIFAGINGVGKSTLYNYQKCTYWKEDLGERINPDEILQGFNGDWKNVKDVMKSGRIAVASINRCLKNNLSFNWETTILSHYVISKMQEAKSKGYKINLFFIGTANVENQIQRIKQRVEKGGHGIPEELVRARFEKQFTNIDKAIAIADSVAFQDNEKVMKVVGAFYHNIMVFKDEECAWLNNIYRDKTKDFNK